MRTGACLAVAVCLAAVAPARADRRPDVAEKPNRAVWTEPVGIVVFAATGGLYLPVGVSLPFGARRDLVLEATVSYADWYGCATRSTGVFLAGGFLYFVGPKRGGLFLQTKLLLRMFETHGGKTGTYFGCNQTQLEDLQGWDGSFGLGLDVGYRMHIGPVVLEPVFGVGASVCVSCPGGSPFFVGPVTLGGDHLPRTVRPVLELNLHLLRVGVRF